MHRLLEKKNWRSRKEGVAIPFPGGMLQSDETNIVLLNICYLILLFVNKRDY